MFRYTMIIGLFVASAFSAAGRAQRTSYQQPTQVVVLRNGNVLSGSVQNVNRRLVISNGQKRVTRVSLDDVDFVCADLNAAYRRKLARIRNGTVDQHLQLARWCMRYELQDAAVERLLYLNRVAPHHYAVKAFEKRLRRLASDQQSTMTQPAQMNSLEPDVTWPANLKSSGMMAGFSRVVQPLLVNRCGQNTCHGDASRNGFRLTRGLRGTPNRQETRNNLLAVVQQIDNHDFEASPLLLKARTIHGNGHNLPIEPHERKQYERLYDWVKSISLGAEDAESATGVKRADLAGHSGAAPRIGAPDPSASDDPFAHLLNNRAGAMPSSAAPGSSSADPFDPTGFNSTLGDEPR